VQRRQAGGASADGRSGLPAPNLGFADRRFLAFGALPTKKVLTAGGKTTRKLSGSE